MTGIKSQKKKLFFSWSNNQAGFTLLEMMVSVALFSSVVLMATGIFKSVLDSQRSILADQAIQEAASYALETMAKEIRTAQPNDGTCSTGLVSLNEIYSVSGASLATSLTFLNDQDECVTYYLQESDDIYRLKIDRGADSGFVTPDEIEVTDLNFRGMTDSAQPGVILTMRIEYKLGKEEFSSPILLQTTVSSRYYNAFTNYEITNIY